MLGNYSLVPISFYVLILSAIYSSISAQLFKRTFYGSTFVTH